MRKIANPYHSRGCGFGGKLDITDIEPWRRHRHQETPTEDVLRQTARGGARVRRRGGCRAGLAIVSRRRRRGCRPAPSPAQPPTAAVARQTGSRGRVHRRRRSPRNPAYAKSTRRAGSRKARRVPYPKAGLDPSPRHTRFRPRQAASGERASRAGRRARAVRAVRAPDV